MKKKEFWDFTWKILLVAALLIGIVNLTMNLLSIRLESHQEAVVTETSEAYIPEETAIVAQVFAAGMIDYGLKAPQVQDYSVCFEALHDLISNYEIASCTQRTLAGTQVPAAFAENVREIGIDAVGLATPNAMANGKEGVEKALVFWDAQELQQAGMNWSTDQSNLIRPFELNGISVVFLSYTDILDDELPDSQQYLVNVYDDESTPQFVEAAAEEADIVIVSICWEGGNLEDPSDRQKTVAKALADAGASVIMGNAENAVQPVAWIDDTLVFYSMGNLLSDADENMDRIGIVGAVTVTKTVLYDKVKIELTNPKVDLIYSAADESGQYCSRLFTSLAENDLEDADEIKQQYTECLLRMDDSIRIGGMQ